MLMEKKIDLKVKLELIIKRYIWVRNDVGKSGDTT